MCPHGPEALPLPHTPVASGRRDVPARYADNRRIWINLRDVFPHPYTLADARFFLEWMATEKPQTTFAIATASEAIGCIGLRLGADVHRRTAELGYWLGEPFWGRGIMTEAVGVRMVRPRADLCRAFRQQRLIHSRFGEGRFRLRRTPAGARTTRFWMRFFTRNFGMKKWPKSRMRAILKQQCT